MNPFVLIAIGLTMLVDIRLAGALMLCVAGFMMATSMGPRIR